MPPPVTASGAEQTATLGAGRTFERVVTVLGMHRSGTSAVTRILNLLGAGLGDEAALIPPAPDNPRGFWENRPLVHVADRLMALLGGTWDAPPDLPDGWAHHPVVEALTRAAGEVFDRLARPGDPVIAVKDPRSCLLQPFWDRVIDQRTRDHRRIHVVRDPDAVVGSLSHRNGMDTEHAARLWVRYVGDVLRHAPKAPTFFQEEVFTRTDETVMRLARTAGLSPPTSEVLDSVKSFLDVGLQRQRGHVADDGPWVELARRAYRDLRDGAAAADVLDIIDPGTAELTPPTWIAQPALAAVGSEPPPGWLGTAAAPRTPRDGHVAAWPSPAPADAYRFSSRGWTVVDLPPEAVVRALRPEALLLTDERSGRAALSGLLDHAPTTRILVTDQTSLRRVADAVVTPRDTPETVRRKTRIPLADTTPDIAAVAPVEQRRGVVSVVIPVHGGWELTRACLDALSRSTDHPLEIVVVDNASRDETPRELARRDDVDVVVRSETNLGFAGGVNAGLNRTSGEYVCILNNDTEPVSGWLDELLAALESSGTGMVGPRTNRISGPQMIAGSPGFGDVPTERLHDWAQAWSADRPRASWSLPRLVGFCLLTRRSLLEDIGGLDQGVGLGNYEDDELCSRVRDRGLRCRVAERSVVLHHGSATFAEARIDRLAAMIAGARHTEGRLRRDSDSTTAVILASDDPDAVAATLIGLGPVVDAIEVWERGDAHRTEVALGALPSTVRIRAIDWQDDDRAEQAVITIGSDRVLLLEAGERLVVDDPTAARLELESGVGDGIARGHTAEVRVIPPTADAVRRAGQPTDQALRSLRLL